MFLRKLFLDRDVLIYRSDGYWEAYNDWYGVGTSRCSSKEEAFEGLQEGIDTVKEYREGLKNDQH